jgi:hypothetical protein
MKSVGVEDYFSFPFLARHLRHVHDFDRHCSSKEQIAMTLSALQIQCQLHSENVSRQ